MARLEAFEPPDTWFRSSILGVSGLSTSVHKGAREIRFGRCNSASVHDYT